MKPRFHSRHSLGLIVVGCSLAGLSTQSALADNTWTGGGTTTNWSDAGNWTTGAITNSYFGTLTFTTGGTQGTTNIDDVSGANGNKLFWTGTSAWTLNGSNNISLFDNGGVQAKIENQSTGLVTINAPITFAATTGAAWGEINAVNGDVTFGAGGSLMVNGSSVAGIKMFGSGRTTTFNNTVSATGKWFATTGASASIVAIGGAFTSGDIYLMNGSTLKLNSGGSISTSALRLGGDFGTTLTQNLALGAMFQFTNLAGGQSFSSIINTVGSNTSGALLVDSQNTSGTNTLGGSVILDSDLKIQQASGGTLSLTGGSVDLKAQTLTIAGSGNTTIGEIISNSTGSGKLTKSGAGTLTLSSASIYTGTTTISAGTLGLTGSLASTALSFGGGALSYAPAVANSTQAFTTTAVAAGAPTLTVATGSTLALGTTGRTAGAGLLVDRTSSTGTVSATAGTGAALVNGVLPWALVKTGSGAASNGTAAGYNFATITGGNVIAYTSATAVTTSYPATSATTNYDWSATGTQAQIGSSRAANTIRFTGTAAVTQTTNSLQTQTFNALINAGGGLVTLGGGGQTMNIQPSTTTNELVLGAMTSGITINGPIINNGSAASVTILGTGSNTVTLAGTNTYTGTTTIDSGTLSVSANANLGSITVGQAPVTINGGTLLVSAGFTNTHAITIGAGGGSINVNAGTGQLYVHTASTLIGSGPLTLQKTSGGTLAANSGNLRIDVANTGYTGNVIVQGGGIFEYGATNAVGTASTFTLNNESELSVNSGVTAGNAITVAGGTNSVLSFENGTAGVFSGPVILNANATIGLRDWYNYATIRSGTISGVVSGTGGLSINTGTATGAGTLTLSGANTYTGATSVSAGTLTAGVASVAGVSGAFGLNTAVTTANVVNAGINLNGFNTQIGSLAGGGTTGGNLALGSATLTTGANNTSTVYAGAITGTGGIAKIGTGTQTLISGSNAYTGATNINAGTLAFSTNAQNLGSSAFAIADGAGLSVKAVSAGSTILTTGSLTVGSAGSTSLAFDLGAFNPTVPQISTGALALNGTIGVSFAGTSGLGTNTYTLIDYTGALGGSGFSSFNPTAFTFGHSSGTLVNNTGNTSIDLSVVADSLAWSGAGVQTWTTAATGNNTPPNDWATKNGHAATNFWVADAVEFNDTYNVGAGDVAVANRTVTITGADVNPSGVTFNNSTGDYTVTGSFGITGSGVLIKNGTSAATINTSNSYTGGTTINAGILAINSATSLGSTSGALTLNNGTLVTTANITSARNISLGGANSTILTDSGTTYTASGVVSGSGTLNKSGAGTLVLSGVNTYTGGTTVTAGVLSVGADNNLGTSASGVTLDGGALRTTAGITNTHAITIGAGGGTINVNATGQYYFTTANTLLGSGTLTVVGNSGTLAGQMAGAGNLRVDKTNTFSGTIIAQSGGIFEYGIANAVASGATFSIGNEGELAVQGSSAVSFANAITVGGGVNSILSFENGNSGVFSGPVTLNANATIGLRDWYNNATVHSGAIGGVISGTGGLTTSSGTAVAGNPVLTLTAATTYAGATTIGANTTLQLGNGTTGNDGTIAGTSGVTNNGTLTFNRFGASSASYAIGGTGALTKTGAGTQTLTGTNSYTGATTVTGGTLAINGANTGAGTNVTLTGTVGLTLGNTSALGAASLINLTGGTSVGTLTYATDGGDTAYQIGMSSGATYNIVLDRASAGTTVTHNLDTPASAGGLGSGTVNFTTGTNVSGIATADFAKFNLGGGSGGTTLLAPAVGTVVTIGSVTKSNNNVSQILGLGGVTTGNQITGIVSNGAAVGANNISVIKSNSSTWTLSGASTYTGATTVSGGTLTAGVASVVNTSGAFGNNSALTTVDVAGALVDLNDFNTQIGSLAGGGVAGGNITLGSATLTTGANNTSTSYAGIISGSGGLVKTGTGVQTLTGINTYTGPTTINSGGTLSLGSTGSIANSAVITANGTLDVSAQGGVTIGTTQTLKGSGTVNVGSGGNLAIAGTLAAGSSPGVLTVSDGGTGSTSFSSGSIFSWDLDTTLSGRGTAYDGVDTSAVSGADAIFQVVLQGTETFGDAFWTTAHSWTDIFTTNGTTPVTSNLATVFSSFTYANSSGSLSNPSSIGSFTLTGSTLSWSAVPEPTSALAGLLLGAGLLRRRRSQVLGV